MPKFFVKNNQIDNDKIVILGQDVNHISNVLRMKKGERLNICNMDNTKNYIVEIEDVNKLKVECKVVEELISNSESNVEVYIYQGLPKADKLELIIQKSVELGVKEIIPVDMKRCIVKLDEKDKAKKFERWNKIAEVAAKQSERDVIPVVQNVKSIKEIISDFSQYNLILLCYENEKEVFLKDILKEFSKHINEYENIKVAVVIGPEGGIDETEVEYMKKNGANVISLGNRILRTETVALSVLSIIMYELERNDV